MPAVHILILSLFVLIGQIASAADHGHIVGKITLPKKQSIRIPIEKYTGKISGKVAPLPSKIAGVWLTGPHVAAPNKPKPVTLNQKNYQFGKSLVIVPTGTRIYFPNKDDDYHNVYSLSRKQKFDLGRYKKGDSNIPFVDFNKPAIIQLRCEIHEHMRSTVLVVDSPYTTTTDESGNFHLSNIPPGTYTLHAQLDKKNKWSTKITVSRGKTATASMKRKK